MDFYVIQFSYILYSEQKTQNLTKEASALKGYLNDIDVKAETSKAF